MTPEGIAQLKRDEGCRLQAYPDPLSSLAKAQAQPEASRPAGWESLSGAPWTVGYGCTGAEITSGTEWTQDEADAQLLTRVAQFEAQLDKAQPWVATLRASDPVRADVLVNVAFNIGVPGLGRWPQTLSAVKAGRFAEAAADMLNNHVWRNQVKARCDRCAAAMRTGQWGGAPAAAS